MPFLVRLVLRYSRGHFNSQTAVLLDHEVLAATYEAMHLLQIPRQPFPPLTGEP